MTVGQVIGLRSGPRCLYFQIGKSHEDTSLRIRLSMWYLRILILVPKMRIRKIIVSSIPVGSKRTTADGKGPLSYLK
jgi:hypothetical protein